jgi:hypothetical protein
MEKINVSKDENPAFFTNWYVNPTTDGSGEPDPLDLKETQDYIQAIYTEETQAQITITVRSEIADW